MEEKPRILIVDDSEINIDVLFEVLQDEYEILVATDGQTAVGVALQEQPDLILLDVMMPKMNGYPEGLSSTDIPLSARIMNVADTYDAIISQRVYKPAMSHIEAADIITRASGTMIDPEVAEAFASVKESFRKTALELANGDDQRTTIG